MIKDRLRQSHATMIRFPRLDGTTAIEHQALRGQVPDSSQWLIRVVIKDKQIAIRYPSIGLTTIIH
jgi:hypothetical protein